ncbi:MAG: hypothetical protein ACPHN3_11505, partial [Spongiibacter sp.]
VANIMTPSLLASRADLKTFSSIIDYPHNPKGAGKLPSFHGLNYSIKTNRAVARHIGTLLDLHAGDDM